MATSRQFPDWIQAYMQYTANTEAPDKMHFWTAVSVIAGALRRRVWISQGDVFKWVPNFYIVFVAPPGIVSKSTTASIGMRLLRELKGINFGPDSLTWQALTQSMGNGMTEHVAINGKMHPMTCVTLSISEFGVMLDTENKQMIDVLTDLWDGSDRVWHKSTKTSGNDVIENPWINMIACTTPAWIAQSFSSVAVMGGFVSRCIFVYADHKRRLVALPGEEVMPGQDVYRARLVEDLQRIAELKGEFVLDNKAKAWVYKWYEEHNALMREAVGSATEILSNFAARKQTHMVKLAMILSAARRDDKVITTAELETAAIMIDALELDLPKIFRVLGAGMANMTVGIDLVQWMERRNAPVKKSEAYRAFFSRCKSKDFDDLLVSAVKAGYILLEQRGNDEWILPGPVITSAAPQQKGHPLPAPQQKVAGSG